MTAEEKTVIQAARRLVNGWSLRGYGDRAALWDAVKAMENAPRTGSGISAQKASDVIAGDTIASPRGIWVYVVNTRSFGGSTIITYWQTVARGNPHADTTLPSNDLILVKKGIPKGFSSTLSAPTSAELDLLK